MNPPSPVLKKCPVGVWWKRMLFANSIGGDFTEQEGTTKALQSSGPGVHSDLRIRLGAFMGDRKPTSEAFDTISKAWD